MHADSLTWQPTRWIRVLRLGGCSADVISYNAQLHHLADGHGRHGHHGRVRPWSRAAHLVKQLQWQGAQPMAFSFECPCDGHWTSQDFTRYKYVQMIQFNWYKLVWQSERQKGLGYILWRILLHIVLHARCGMGITCHGTGGLQPSTVTFNSAMTSSAWEALDHRRAGLIMMGLKSSVDLNGS